MNRPNDWELNNDYEHAAKQNSPRRGLLDVFTVTHDWNDCPRHIATDIDLNCKTTVAMHKLLINLSLHQQIEIVLKLFHRFGHDAAQQQILI